MIKTYKVMLLPNNKQKTKLFECASVARWAYNWALEQEQINYKNGGKFLDDKTLRKRLTQDTDKIVITETQVKLEKLTTSKKKNKQKLNWIKLAETNRIPVGENIKYSNPRVTFDGLNWWLSVGVEIQEKEETEDSLTDGIGIDLGVKDLAVVSTGQKFKNINKFNKVKKLEKRLKRLQRKLSKKYEMNNI